MPKLRPLRPVHPKQRHCLICGDTFFSPIPGDRLCSLHELIDIAIWDALGADAEGSNA